MPRAAIVDETVLAAELRQIEHDVLEAAATGKSLKAAMTLLCERIEALAPEVICSILTVDEDNRVHPLAAPSLPAAYTGPLDGVSIGPGSRFLRHSRLSRRASRGNRYRKRRAMGRIQGLCPVVQSARLLVQSDQGPRWPRPRHLCLLFSRSAPRQRHRANDGSNLHSSMRNCNGA